MKPFRYADGKCPKDYHCAACDAFNCKLWRQYQTCADAIELLCIICAQKNQKTKATIEKGAGDQIGWLVPAIPTEDGETFWGYTSIPVEGCDWWDDLPTRPGGKSPLSELSPYMRRRFDGLISTRDFYRSKLKTLAKEARSGRIDPVHLDSAERL